MRSEEKGENISRAFEVPTLIPNCQRRSERKEDKCYEQ